MTGFRSRFLVGCLTAVAAASSVCASAGLLDAFAVKAVNASRSYPVPAPAGLGAVGFSSCSHLFPKGIAFATHQISPDWKSIQLCSNHFAVLNSTLTKTPLFVVERLNRAILLDAKDEERTDEFYVDPRIPPGERAELNDYKGTRFDRGHLANAADQPDQQSMIQSFALSNMIPQDPVNNRKGAWFKAEIDTRKYVRRAEGNVFVFSGPLFQGQPQTIGRNKVWVPSHLFKLVYDETSGKAWAHIVSNTSDARLDAPVSYAEFVRQTGWQFLSQVTVR